MEVETGSQEVMDPYTDTMTDTDIMKEMEVMLLVMRMVRICYKELWSYCKPVCCGNPNLQGTTPQSKKYKKQETDRYELVVSSLNGVCNAAVAGLKDYSVSLGLHAEELQTTIERLTDIQDERRAIIMHEIALKVFGGRLKEENKKLAVVLATFSTNVKNIYVEMRSTKVANLHHNNKDVLLFNLDFFQVFAEYLSDELDKIPSTSDFKLYLTLKRPNRKVEIVY